MKSKQQTDTVNKSTMGKTISPKHCRETWVSLKPLVLNHIEIKTKVEKYLNPIRENISLENTPLPQKKKKIIAWL